MNRIDVLALGEVLVDLLSEEFVADLSQARTFRMHAGGSPANLCANLNWLGANTAIVSGVGQDKIGDFVLNALQSNRVDTRYVERVPQQPTSMVVVGRSKDTPDFIAYRGADYHIGPVDQSLISSSRIVHTTAFALSREPARRNILEAFKYAFHQNKITSVDWNFAPSLWTESGNDVWSTLLETRPLLKISHDDISRFYGNALTIDDARLNLDKISSRAICLTCGKDGVWYRGDASGSWIHHTATPVLEVKDTTGAGDAFWSGFLFEFNNGRNGEECVKKGLAIAAQKIQKVGPLYAEA